jgi:hypothetical protein
VIRDDLWCSFSRLIIAKQSGASLAMDLSHSRPHKSFDHAPSKPFRRFLTVFDRVVANCIDTTCTGRGPAAHIEEGDARNLSQSNGSVDLVLTSPPYLNAIDYMRCSKFSLVWMGHSIAELRRLRSESLGTEVGMDFPRDDQDIRRIIADLRLRPRLRPRDEGVLVRYVDDMRRTLREAARVLVPGGRAVFVVGENSIRGTHIKNSLIVSSVATLSGLRLRERQTRALPGNRRYLPPPIAEGQSPALNARMRREVVLCFEKPHD